MMKKTLIRFLESVLLLIGINSLTNIRAFSQDRHLIDSLTDVIAVTKQDTTKVKLIYEIGQSYRRTKPDSALYHFKEALELAERIKAKKLIAQCLIAIGANLNINGLPDSATGYLERALKISEEISDEEKIITCLLNIGIVYHDQGSFDKAIEYYLKSVEISEKIGFRKGLSRSYNNLGIAYYDQGSYDESIEYYLKALKIHEELGDKSNMAACYNNIGLVHLEQKSYDKTIEYLQKALVIHEETGDKRAMSGCYLNLGMVSQKQGSYENATEDYNKALKLFEELGNKRGTSETNHNLGELYLNQGLFDKASEYYLRALKIYEEIGDKKGMAILGINLASLNISLADSVAVTDDQKRSYLNQAIIHGGKSLANAKEMNLLPIMKEAANILMTIYTKLGDYKRAFEFAGLYIDTQDSMFMEDKTRAIQEMSAKYETEKKQQQIELQESQLIAKDARIKQQKTFRNALIGGLVAIILIVFIIAYAYRQKLKDNQKIREQNEKILQANEDLKQLNELTSRQKKEIISSINYAQRIQSAILPPETHINELLKENFIFYKPKEIVSGDFYWIKQVRHYTILVSADCTGHGVPGAFMSMLGISYLNEIVQKRHITRANQVLNEMRKEIKRSLHQSGKLEEPKDGMDLAICVIDSKKNIMQYSGANNPLYLIRNNNGESVFREIQADRMPVGIHLSHDRSFTNHEIQLEAGDTFYLFSDGFMDQNGGNSNSRFTSKKFKKLLLDIHDHTMSEQKEILDQTLRDWMGEYPQRDDILVIGARI